MQFSDPDLRQLSPTLEALAAVELTLPGEALALRNAIDRLEAERRDAGVPGADEDAYVTGAVLAARDDKPLPDVAELLEARHRNEATVERSRLLGLAVEQAGRLLRSVLTHEAEALIVGPLRDALARLLEEAAEAAKACGSTTTAEQAVSAPDKARRGFVALGTLAGRYAALRDAHRRLRALVAPPKHDDTALFSEFRAGLREVWPSYSTRKGAPWPEGATGRLRWIASHPEAQPWLPTASEQDDRWREVIGPAAERQRTNLLAARAVGVRL